MHPPRLVGGFRSQLSCACPQSKSMSPEWINAMIFFAFAGTWFVALGCLLAGLSEDQRDRQ